VWVLHHPGALKFRAGAAPPYGRFCESTMTNRESPHRPPRRGLSAISAFARNPIIAIPYLMSCALAFLLPDDALDRWSALKAWAAYIEQYVPILANYAGQSAFPQVTAAYFSIVLAMTPAFFWVALTTPGFLVDSEKLNRRRAEWGLFYELMAWMGVPLLLFLAYFGVAINPGYDFNVMPINRSRIALALFGPLFAGGLTAICAAAALKLGQTLLNKGS